MRTFVAEGSVRTPPGIRTPAMDYSLRVFEMVRKANQSLKWGAFNGVLLAIVLYDIMNTCPEYSSWMRYAEAAVALLLAISVVFHLSYYIWITISIQPVALTSEQMKLLGVKKSDPYFKTSTPESSSSATASPDFADLISTTPMNLSATSWRSASYLSSGRSDGLSPNYSISATSWEYLPTSPGTSMFTQNGSPVKSPKQPVTPSIFDQSNFTNPSFVGFIDDEDSLSKYLREYDTYEQSFGATMEQSLSPLSSLWKCSSSGADPDQMAMPRGCNYQLACPTPAQSLGSPGGLPGEGGSPTSLKHKSLDMWHRLGVKPNMLTQWNSNLRMWISQTVLERLVQEMDAVDEALQRYGLTDMKIGSVGLERLKKTALVAQVAQNIPTLPRLVPFFELTTNQEYLVARIRELAKGGCMSDFRWNGGGSLHGKDWEEHLPTDSALVMHLLATYLDTQLPPQPQNPDRRAFTSEYLVKFPAKVPPEKTTPVIQEVQVNPPHYVLVVKGERMEVEMGRNNFFHTIILFLHHMKTSEHGMLGRINLGPSGINLLWVIES